MSRSSARTDAPHSRDIAADVHCGVMYDFEFTFLDGAPDSALVESARRTDGVAGAATRLTADLLASAKGGGLDRLLGDLTVHRQRADRGADLAVVAATGATDARRGVSAWASAAPAWSEVLAERKAVADAEQAQRTLPAGATDADAKAVADRVAEAKRRLADVEHRRRSANSVLVGALGRAAGKLPSAKVPKADGGGRAIPGAPLPTPPRGEKMPAYPGPPGPGLPPRNAPPAAPPSTNVASGTSPSTDALAQVLAAASKPAVAAQMPMQQMPQAMPAMQMPAMPQVTAQPQPAPSRDRKRKDALTADDIDDLLDKPDAPATPGLAATATVTPPRPAPAGAAPAPAAPAPTGPAGFSADGLVAKADTSGRPTPPAGAFAAPATSLSGSHIASQAAPGAAPGAAPATNPGTGAPMGPMGGMPGGGAGGGGGSGSRPPVLKHQGLDHGQSAMDEAVPGGTIAQRKDDPPPPRR